MPFINEKIFNEELLAVFYTTCYTDSCFLRDLVFWQIGLSPYPIYLLQIPH